MKLKKTAKVLDDIRREKMETRAWITRITEMKPSTSLEHLTLFLQRVNLSQRQVEAIVQALSEDIRNDFNPYTPQCETCCFQVKDEEAHGGVRCAKGHWHGLGPGYKPPKSWEGDVWADCEDYELAPEGSS